MDCNDDYHDYHRGFFRLRCSHSAPQNLFTTRIFNFLNLGRKIPRVFSSWEGRVSHPKGFLAPHESDFIGDTNEWPPWWVSLLRRSRGLASLQDGSRRPSRSGRLVGGGKDGRKGVLFLELRDPKNYSSSLKNDDWKTNYSLSFWVPSTCSWEPGCRWFQTILV